jgi:RsiW-degrading membrane proteinase PrsW (M82 family)
MSEVLRAFLSLTPVLVFLAALTLLDSFRLVAVGRVLRALAYGAAAALVLLFVARAILGTGVVSATFYRHYFGPVLEELGKAALVIAAIRWKRVGFMVDAAILGFATGAGFAAAENVYYLLNLASPNLLSWVVRGFGTAVMHGSTTAVVGIASVALVTRLGGERLAAFLPGLGIAIVAHSVFNHFVLPPVLMSGVLIVSFSTLVVVVFERSEHLLRDWLEIGLGTDMELLEMLRSGTIRETRVGVYLRSLTNRFPGEVLADMLCYLAVMVELSIKAKVALLARRAGLPMPADPEIAERLTELRHLERNIGTTGRLALAPLLRVSSRDLWQLSLLETDGARRAPDRG